MTDKPSKPVEPRYVELSGHMKATGGVAFGPAPWRRTQFEAQVANGDDPCFQEDPYVAYFWRLHLECNEGHCSRKSPGEGTVWVFYVKPGDVQMFPELAGVDQVVLLHTEDVPGGVPSRVHQI